MEANLSLGMETFIPDRLLHGVLPEALMTTLICQVENPPTLGLVEEFQFGRQRIELFGAQGP
jgi:hypothetical protein